MVLWTHLQLISLNLSERLINSQTTLCCINFKLSSIAMLHLSLSVLETAAPEVLGLFTCPML